MPLVLISFNSGVAFSLTSVLHVSQSDKDAPKMLKEYCKDLNAEVLAGRIDPVGYHCWGTLGIFEFLEKNHPKSPNCFDPFGINHTGPLSRKQ